MTITSLTFIAFALLVVLAGNAAGSASRRAAVLALANAVFLASQVDTPAALLPLALFVALPYPALRGLRRAPAWALPVCLVLVLAAFVILKRFAFLDGQLALPFPYLTLGLSYLLFRLMHLMIDAASGELPEAPGALHYFNYTCNFLSFVSGPIQRYQEFAAADREPPGLDAAQVFAAFSRIVTGYVKVAVVSAALHYLFDHLAPPLLGGGSSPAGGWPVVGYGAAAAAYTGYLYFNFAGYMDIVIGIGALLGQRLPENFRQPFAARNFLEFWSRWHITLSEWFKTYLFNPLLKALAGRFRSPGAAPALGVLAFFVTFLLIGLWHGTTPVFAVYGLLLGGGAAANKLWQLVLARRLGKAGYRALADNGVYRDLCRGATFAYFALALTCLWVDLVQLGALGQALGPAGIAGSFALLALGGALAAGAGRWLRALCGGLAGRPRSTGKIAGFFWRNTHLAGRALLVLMASSFFHKAPEFVYRAF